MKKVCVITGSRAEYGILKPLISKINEDKEIELQLIATGMHLSPEFGLTYKEIEKDRFKITEKVEVILSSDSSVGVCKAMGLGLISFGECFQRLNPDLIVVLGDRYEILSAATAAMMMNIPIAHIHGGEITEGAVDDSIRHAITKMSYLHFTSTEIYRKRVIQLGEAPQRVYNVGALGVENIKNVELLSKEALEKDIQLDFSEKIALVTFHPVTLEKDSARTQFNELLNALSHFRDLKIIFTKANADAEGRIINQMIEDYAKEHLESCKVYTSLGQKRYLSALKYCSVVIGNSSSGIIEAPSFGVPVINIGNRQKGRIHSKAVIDCTYHKDEIIKAIEKALDKDFYLSMSDFLNPYEGSNTSAYIIKVIKEFLMRDHPNINKKFYDLERGEV